MSANIRKAAAARGLSITVNARSESSVEDYVDEIDCLMIGPHLASTLPEMEEICGLILYGTKQGSGPALNSAADHRQHK